MTSPKVSNPRSKKQTSVDNSDMSEMTSSMTDSMTNTTDDTGGKPNLDQSESVEEKPGDKDEEIYESESSESDDEVEATGLTAEEEKERQREKREKVRT